MVVSTVALFWKASEQSESAYKAVTVSDSTLKFYKESAKKADSESQIFRKKDEDRIIARFKLDSENAQKQIGALNKAVNDLNKQFEIENLPLITISLDVPVSIIAGNYLKRIEGNINFTYTIKNVGNYPTKILKAAVDIFPARDTTGMSKVFKYYLNPIPANYYVSKEVPVVVPFSRNSFAYDSGYLQSLDRRYIFLFICGKLLYENPVNKKLIRTNTFILVPIFPIVNGRPEYYFIKNDNE